MLPFGSRLLGTHDHGHYAENLAEKYGISRGRSGSGGPGKPPQGGVGHQGRRFKAEIVPYRSREKGRRATFEQDEHPRFGLTMEDLARLKPAFKKDGTVTAGNSSGLNDAAARPSS